MKRVTLGAVLRECRRRGISFADDYSEAAKICADLARDMQNIKRKYWGKFSIVSNAIQGTDLYRAFTNMTTALTDMELYSSSLARKLKK